MFTELFPVIATPDVARALGFYRDLLGGRVTHEFPGADGTPAYVGLDLGSSHMGIGFDPRASEASSRAVSVWIYADDCDAAVARLRGQGVRVMEEPRDQPLGDRVARVLDPDGNEVVIGERGGGVEGLLGSIGASLMSPEPALYTRPEFERRFLVAPGDAWRAQVEANSKTLEDIYIRHTYLRLRTLWDSATGQEFIKLTKKLRSSTPYVQMTGSIPLSPMEFELLTRLEGERIRKVRHYHFHRGHVFAIDVFEGDLQGLVLCEVEAASLDELMAIEPPDYVQAEVTEDPFFTGGVLAGSGPAELAGKLAALRGGRG